MKNFLQKIKRILFSLLIVLVVLAVVSFFAAGEKTNPPVKNTVKWDSPATKDYFYRACADCHSNETKWPWYTNFAPISQMLIQHVEDGRSHFNISQLDMGDSDEAVEEFSEGKMPLKQYLDMHQEAIFTEKEKKEFIAGLRKTFGEKRKAK